MNAEQVDERSDMRLDGLRVIVTGAAHGMGRSHCEFMAARGATVGAIDVDPAVQGLAEPAAEDGGRIFAAIADISDRDQVEDAVESLAARMGGLDGVVSNAGNIHTEEGLEDTDDATWSRTFAIHVDGARNLCRAALPRLRRSPAPRIVIITSLWAQRGPGYGYAYCSAKGALLAFARNAAVELAADGILVNSVSPGSVYTRMAEGLDPRDIAENAALVPLQRWAQPEEVSRLVAFLASRQATYLTGQMISINGGEVLAGG